MTTPVSGQVVQPSAVIDPASNALHDFGLVMKNLLTRAGNFHDQAQLEHAHGAVDALVKHLTPAKDRAHVLRESDPAPYEDVTQRRVPTGGGLAPVMAGSHAIDYDRLAAALIAAQAAQQVAATDVHVITDATASE